MTDAINESLEIFPWNENFATGIPQIDEQHRKLVHLLNRLAGGIASKADALDLNHIFNELTEYAAYHFQTEESVWQQFLAGDELEALHQATHKSFVAEVLRLKSEENAKPLGEVLEEVLSFLTRWLAFHILDSDKRTASIVLAVQSGMSLEQAREQALHQTSGATEVLIETVLCMYDALSNRTLQLMKEVNERKKSEQKAHALNQRNQLLMQSTREGIHIMDEQGNVIETNEAFCQHLGYTRSEVLQLSLFDFEAKLSVEELRTNMKNMLNGHAMFESIHRRKDGTLVDVEVIVSGVELEGAKCLFALSRDISGRKRAEQAIKNMAFYDALTQLPNRRLLDDRLNQAMAASIRNGHYGALLFLDLDNFKPLNDKYGHKAGDLLLVEVAHRISGCVREMDTVARFGGDEFVVMLCELSVDRTESVAQAMAVAEKIRAALAKPYTLAMHSDGGGETSIEHRCTSSIGVALFIKHEYSANDIVRLADLAMYQAKDAGRNSIRVHN